MNYIKDNIPDFFFDYPRYSVCRLQPEYSPALRKLMDACVDFMILVVGYSAQDIQVPAIYKKPLEELTTFI
jgi:hypothetical protein